MRKSIVLSIVAASLIATAAIWKVAFAEPTAVPALADIERMTDPRDPSKVSGSFWTQKLDCTYKNPPHEWIIWATPKDCERAEHNLQVAKTKRDYFIPRSTASDDPPYCLMKGPAAKDTVAALEQRRNLYCRKK
jgi:hypothetical protein